MQKHILGDYQYLIEPRLIALDLLWLFEEVNLLLIRLCRLLVVGSFKLYKHFIFFFFVYIVYIYI